MQLIYYSIDKDKRKNGKKHNSIPEGITLTKIWLTLENNDHVCFTPILLPKLEMEIPAFWKCHNICNIKQQKCCEKSFLQGSSPHCFSIRSKMWFNSYKSYHNGRVSWQKFSWIYPPYILKDNIWRLRENKQKDSVLQFIINVQQL